MRPKAFTVSSIEALICGFMADVRLEEASAAAEGRRDFLTLVSRCGR